MDIKQIGLALAARRRELKLKQRDLATRTGVSRGTIIAAESGERDIGVMTLLSLLKGIDLKLTIDHASDRPTESQLRAIFGDDDE